MIDIPIPHVLEDETLFHILDDHVGLASEVFTDNLYKTAFPFGFYVNDLTNLLVNTRSIRELPEESVLYWWPSDRFVLYLVDDKGGLVRLVVIGNKEGEVVTIYPTLGKGVKY